MPIYEYKCQNCYTDFETIVNKSEPKISCPNCESEDVVKVISFTHFRHADHWMQDMQRGMARSKEIDQMKAEIKKTSPGSLL